jgi:hypothetical protein
MKLTWRIVLCGLLSLLSVALPACTADEANDTDEAAGTQTSGPLSEQIKEEDPKPAPAQ